MKTYTLLYPNGATITRVEDDGKIIATTFQAEEIEVTDNYHTMSDLYAHRNRLFIALCKCLDKETPISGRYRVIKSWKHYDGSMFDDSFIVMVEIKMLQGLNEQISYHLPAELWNDCPFLELPTALAWDGHTSDDVLERLMKL